MPHKDYYQILGVSKNSSADEIKQAYRRLARQYHPDVSKEHGAEQKFKDINEAYQILGDPNKKNQYDTFGSTGGPQGFGGINFEDLFQGFGSSQFGNIEDIFEGFFGGGGRRQKKGPQKGNDLQYEMDLSLEEAYLGGEKEVEIQNLDACHICKGFGAEPGTQSKKCPACNGIGQVQQSQRTILGSFTQVVPCVKCAGTGEIISNPCKNCRGSGRIKSSNKVKVKIPAGIDNGYRLRISNAGDAGIKGGPHGDLYILINVAQHTRFKRQGDDLFLTEKIDFVSAILGETIELKTLTDKTTLKIPPGTQPNTVFRMKEHGMPHLHGYRKGDLFVEIKVEIPTRLSKDQIELLKKIKGLK